MVGRIVELSLIERDICTNVCCFVSFRQRALRGIALPSYYGIARGCVVENTRGLFSIDHYVRVQKLRHGRPGFGSAGEGICSE